MEGHILQVSLCSNRIKSEKNYRELRLANVVAAICALLNSNGGKVSLEFEGGPVLQEDAEAVLRMVEQRVVDIIGPCTFYSNLTVQRANGHMDFIVDPMELLCTLNYNIYLPTETQVIPISPSEPSERVKVILNREIYDQQLNFAITAKDFVQNKRISIKEFDCIQFKQLKAERSKCVSLADRITNKSNKLERYISAFANKRGGQLYYGITEDGVVKGEVLGDKDQEEIVKKVTKTINHMMWRGGKLEKGKQWNIQFEPVKDDNMNEIPSLFVVIIWVTSLRGGLFAKEPESYHVVKGRVERISFSDWSGRFFNDMVPSGVGRSQWSSVKAHKMYYKVTEKLVMFQNNGDSSSFERFAKLAQTNYPDSDVGLTILAEGSACAYKKGNFLTAESLLAQYNNQCLSSSPPKDVSFFKLRGVYARSAISRAKGCYQESYNIAKDGLQLAEMVPAGISVAWFYNHVAMVETILSQRTEEIEERTFFVNSAQDHYTKALQHTRASSVEQEFLITVADLHQRIHILRAITSLGDFAGGGNVGRAKLVDIEAAKKDLAIHSGVILDGFSETSFRKIHRLFAMSDLNLCQWQQTQGERSAESNETPGQLKVAFDYAKEALKLAKECQFGEMTCYASKRLAVLTETIIRLKLSTAKKR